MKNSVVYFILIVLVLVLAVMTCSPKANSKTIDKQNQLATMNNYTKEWKEIKELEAKGLLKSALQKVLALHERAKKEQNDPQVIKTILYRERFSAQLEEYGFENSVRTFQEEVKSLKGISKSIMHFMIGRSLATYLEANRWQFSNRTTTPSFKPESLETWSIQHFIEEIDRQFEMALANEDLKKASIKEYDAVTSKGSNTDHLRPTIYDLITHQILDYYANPNSYLTEPVYKFYLDQKEVFANAEDFAKYNFISQDSTSRLFKSAALFQEVLKHHIRNGKTEALVDADLKRLQFALNNSTLGDKGKSYLEAVEKLSIDYKKNDSVMPVLLLTQAQFYQQSVNHLNDEKNNLKEAHRLLTKLITDFPNARIKNDAKNILKSIEAPHLNVETEKVYPIGENMLSLINYKNIESVYFELYKIVPEEEYNLRNNSRDQLKEIRKKSLVKEWSQKLPESSDFHNLSTEISIDIQSSGKYILLSSSNKLFAKDNSNVSLNFISVSNLTYVMDSSKNNSQMIIVDRLSGKPIEGAEVSFFQQNYNASLRRNQLKLRHTSKSDANGMIQAKLDKGNSFIPKIEYGDDVLFLRDWLYQQRPNNPRDRNVANIFLDRMIYRPGQTIYFKAIAHNVNGKTQLPRLLPNERLEIVLKDANYQDVEQLTLTTNEYGSVNGSFTAPIGGLLGNMNIQIQGYGGVGFSVEEYKRPKFEAKFSPVETSYALGEKVTVSGKAIGFAGNAIGDAKVVYRVERGVTYPYWRSWYRWYRPQAPMRILNGSTTSKSDGTFDIEFDLIPDPSTNQKDKPVFLYTVYADITDISGETRSIQTMIKASNVGLDLQLSVGTRVHRDSLKTVNVFTKNLNNKFQPAEVTMKIVSLQSEDRLYRDRYWKFPDTVSFSASEFNSLFPDYRFEKKKSPLQLDEKELIYSETFTSTESGKVNLNGLELSAGLYKISISARDKNGNELEKEVSFEVTDDTSTKPAVPVALLMQQDKASYEPTETANITISTTIENAYVFLDIFKRDRLSEEKWLNFSGKKIEQISIREADRGNISCNSFMIHNSRYYPAGQMVKVPWSNKSLQISYTTFRDKLLPGQEEEWIVKIEGDKKEKIAAEVLAGMYDASLDQFVPNNWRANYFPSIYAQNQWQAGSNFVKERGSRLSYVKVKYHDTTPKIYRQFDWLGFNFYGYRNYPTRSINEMASTSAGVGGRKEKRMMKSAPTQIENAEEMSFDMNDASMDEVEVVGYKEPILDQDNSSQGPVPADGKKNAPKVRTNLNETVFFFPDLKTDKDGNVLIKFKMNEALTKWKFMTFAHTQDLATVVSTKEIVTQKKLMVQPNAPRFFREGDQIRYSAKVSNLTEELMTGTAKLELYDAITDEVLDGSYGNKKNEKSFTAKPGESVALFWDLEIPKDKLGTVLHRVVAQAGKYSDGEESAVPVLTNRKLVTESLPLPVRAGESKEFIFKSMQENKSSTLSHHNFTLEFTSNPAWYAVQSLPYLMEYPHECTEQIFNKYYANALATHVANSTPKIKQIFESWKGTEAMKSNLSKNQELKSALLEETPWVLDAQSEEQQRRNIALLFDLNKMSQEKSKNLKVLSERQLSNGGFAWFPGGRDSWYVTQYLVEGLGHLKTLGIELGDMDQVLRAAVRYIDDRVVEHFQNVKKWNKDPSLSGIVIHYLYARSFFLEYEMNPKTKNVLKHYQGKVKEEWLGQGLYYQGILALSSGRFDMKEVANEITASLKERALSHEELGKYWKYDRGYFWHQMPIETHSVMIEVFEKVAKDAEMVDELRLWLLKNKQTNAWETTKATAAAVYALLMSGDSWLQETKQVDIVFPNKQLNADMAKSQAMGQAGTGYFKHVWNEVNPNLSSVKVNNPNTVPAWGAAYWQYFEDLDMITDFEETPLKLNKQVFLERQGDRGATMDPVKEGTNLSVGDKLKVRIELRVDRDMEFIHMKDMRASGFEPMNVFSQYKWQGGLGYYESTKDASTNFFFDNLPKGTYVFEYPIRVVHQGDFSNGVTTIQSMYAPEFTSHSKGVRIKVGE